ncbi:transcription antitermination factor NusB [Candidatus Bipolaricaulota bacterium]
MQRREAREFVLTALYRREFLPTSLDELFEEAAPGDQRDYIERVYHGIIERQPEIDAMLGERTVGWKFERLALLDRNILRLGTYELLHCADIPGEVALDEAVELAKKYGTEQARSFVNGILDRIWKDKGKRASE